MTSIKYYTLGEKMYKRLNDFSAPCSLCYILYTYLLCYL